MTKQAFLEELRARLRGLPEAERAEAARYYEEYISDAGEGNEAAAVAELGNPAYIAAQIIADYATEPRKRAAEPVVGADAGAGAGSGAGSGADATAGANAGGGEYRASGYGGYDIVGGAKAAEDDDAGAYQSARRGEPEGGKKRRNGFRMFWIVLLAVFASPIALPIAIVLAVFALAIVAMVLAVIVGLGTGGVACCVAGVAGALGGARFLFSDLATFLYLLGAGGVCVGIGLLLLKVTQVLCKYGFAGPIRLLSRSIQSKTSASALKREAV